MVSCIKYSAKFKQIVKSSCKRTQNRARLLEQEAILLSIAVSYFYIMSSLFQNDQLVGNVSDRRDFAEQPVDRIDHLHPLRQAHIPHPGKARR